MHKERLLVTLSLIDVDNRRQYRAKWLILCFAREKLNTNTTQDPVYKKIVDIVFQGDCAPGSRLVEEDLARKIGVGRAKVRETLAKLVGQGVLVSGPKGMGVRVRDYSVDDVRQLFEFREIIEGVAARGAAQMASATDIARLEIICQQARETLKTEEVEKWQELDQLFHLTIAEASRNKRVATALQMMIAESRYLFFVYPNPKLREEGKLERAQEHHEMLLEFIRTRDDKGAEACAREEMIGAGERVIRIMITGSLSTAAKKKGKIA